MKHILLAAFAAIVAAQPAQAQPVAADLLPAYEVATIVTSMGMRPVGRPAWIRGRYVVAAIDRHGREVNVVLDAFDGQVIAVRPLARDSFGAPPPAYGRGPAPYDPMNGAVPTPESGPGGPPPDGEFFDNERQQGTLPPPRITARPSSVPRDPAVTGSVTRGAAAARTGADSEPKSKPQNAAPMPRPRPALARANDPGNQPAAAAKPAPAVTPEAAAKPEEKKREAAKPDGAKPDPKPGANAQPAKPAAKPEPASTQANKPDATPEKDVRVIDLSKPKTATKPEPKPGEAIRF